MAAKSDRPNVARPLPEPYMVVGVLKALSVLALLAGAAAIILQWAVVWPQTQDTAEAIAAMSQGRVALEVDTTAELWQTVGTSAMIAVVAIAAAAALCSLAMIVRYSYHTALNVHMAERERLTRGLAAAAAGEAADTGTGGDSDRVVALLKEISENTLLDEQERSRKRSRLAETHRERAMEEVEQLIAATKWPQARRRLDDLRNAYAGDPDVMALGRRLESAVREHQEVDVMTSCEQIRSYMSLGLWAKAREAAERLSSKYPENEEATKMREVVRMEEQVSQKDDRLRLYREIEHLVARKHYRDAKRVAESLIDRWPETAEADGLRAQMDELSRNADIEVRREMEARIIEHTKQGRHKEAYEVARLLMEQYPDSPQAVALQEQIEKLRERAGVA